MEDDDNIRAGQDGPPAAAPSKETEPLVETPAEVLKRQYDELNERFLRLAADFENYRKRAERDREQIIRHANEQMALDVLEVTDNLDRAVRFDDASLREGLSRIRQLMGTVLQRHGITPVESIGKKFDPAEHEAIAHVPSEKEEGIVIDETARGYRMHDKVIRYAKVAVSKGNGKNE